MKTERVKARDITRYSIILIWFAAKRDRGKEGQTLTDYLERKLETFLSMDNEEKARLIKEYKTLIKERTAAIEARKKVDDIRNEIDYSYIGRITEEVESLEKLYEAREQCARRIIDEKISCFERFRGGAI